MKTETKITEDNIENYKKILRFYPLSIDYVHCKKHKASCQRFLEFLEGMAENTTIKDSQWVVLHYHPKITDLKNAIKKYEDAGI